MLVISLYHSSCVLHCSLQHNSFNPVLLIFGTSGRYFSDRNFICTLHPARILITYLMSCVIWKFCQPIKIITVASEDLDINKEILLARGNTQCDNSLESWDGLEVASCSVGLSAVYVIMQSIDQLRFLWHQVKVWRYFQGTDIEWD